MTKNAQTIVRIAESLDNREMDELCDATASAVEDGGGFGWLTPPPRQVMETYYSGVVLVPGRTLFLGLLDGMIAGSAQLLRPPLVILSAPLSPPGRVATDLPAR